MYLLFGYHAKKMMKAVCAAFNLCIREEISIASYPDGSKWASLKLSLNDADSGALCIPVSRAWTHTMMCSYVVQRDGTYMNTHGSVIKMKSKSNDAMIKELRKRALEELAEMTIGETFKTPHGRTIECPKAETASELQMKLEILGHD